MVIADPLASYRAKRDFRRTPEPAAGGRRARALRFVIQKHDASHLHYDFRLELDGTLKSWAVPKGPSLDPKLKRMAVQVEDHPISYAGFEGTIPDKQYGAGNVIVWDQGSWLPVGDPSKALKSGKLKFELQGDKLRGHWTLVRMRGKADERQPAWLLIKEKDDQAQAAADYDVLEALPNSVLTGKPLPSKKATVARTPAAKKSAAQAAAKTRRPLPPDAVKAELPPTLAPELATLVTAVPDDGGDWLYEIKFDGYRLLTRIAGKSVQCFTRNGHDWSARLPALVKTLSQLGLRSGWLDGEIVVHGKDGVPDFGALQNAFDSASTAQIVYYVFDMPFYAGHDLRQVPLLQRRELLRGLIGDAGREHLRFSETFDSGAQDLLDSARRLGLEGVIGKRASSPYVSRRSTDWIKVKTQARQEFVIGGYTEPQGSRTGLGALLLGVYDEQGELKHVGKVGTGFDEKTLASLLTALKPLATPRTAFSGLPASVKGHWVQPVLVAEVVFGQWTHAGNIRHAVFQGLRSDKPARKVVRESALPVEKVMAAKKPASPSTRPSTAKKSAAKKTAPALPPVNTGKLRVTHPERIIDPGTGLTKLDLIEYYARVAPLILPHLKARPVALVRAPDGITGELFFQKHAEATSIPGIKLLDPKFDPGHAPLLEIASAEALLAAAQLNVMEFHTWNATTRSIGKPDRMTFDLDPGEGVAWAQVQEAAQLVRAFLQELGLPGFLKTSGGKGLHVVVPLKPAYDWDTVKDFSQAIVQHLAGVIPERFVAKSGPRNRVGKIFPDYLRNGFGATTVCAWSVRARPGMGVSVPVAWEELEGLTGAAHWDARNIGARLATGNSPWEACEKSRATLSSAMKAMDFKPAAGAAAARAPRSRTS